MQGHLDIAFRHVERGAIWWSDMDPYEPLMYIFFDNMCMRFYLMFDHACNPSSSSPLFYVFWPHQRVYIVFKCIQNALCFMFPCLSKKDYVHFICELFDSNSRIPWVAVAIPKTYA